jgi:uncharacterized PurR-regulated membrane protein YhhQ (DUF165 family)
VLTAMFSPFSLFNGLLLIPTGSVFVGATFMLRDFVQLRYGKQITYAAIAVATILSATISWILGDTAFIAAASVIAFLVSESIDTEIFSRAKKSLWWRIAVSGIVGGIADSVIFVILGLSPIGAAMLTWSMVPYAILGQTATKAIVQPIGVLGYFVLTKHKR